MCLNFYDKLFTEDLKEIIKIIIVFIYFLVEFNTSIKTTNKNKLLNSNTTTKLCLVFLNIGIEHFFYKSNLEEILKASTSRTFGEIFHRIS